MAVSISFFRAWSTASLKLSSLDPLNNEGPVHAEFFLCRHVVQRCAFACPFTVFRHGNLSIVKRRNSIEFLRELRASA